MGVTVRLVAWASTQADAVTLATEVRESVLAKLEGLASPVGLQWSRAMSQMQPQTR
jgi:hypothetical protein